MLSVIVICKNEESNIQACLESVAWADEIIVLDSGSSDKTVSICQTFTDKVEITDWPGFGKQKQRALERATQPWVLSIDADERVSDTLKQEILTTIQRGDAACGYNLPRQSSFCGRFMQYSGWSPDYVLRLFRRDQAHFTDDIVHERVICQGPVVNLHTPLLHYTYDSLHQAIEKANLYSDLNAKKLFANGARSSLKKAIFHGFWAFVRTYIIRQGFRDGRRGFMLAVVIASTTYYKYAKLALMQQEP